ncbi:3-deoxy-D-manno-octulosonic-acid transferase [Desulfobotulus alkaliphilus]|uniref:3-deoxy-D-manno-octulosonic acid transferase n=1 Tax=Desulfobotulus alkaliphilus TaxID=622671 RepID=A0A562R2S0_9BACT|nr:glycosyltransferase N-terminal domain-containing protein [Desulfobotulus alkaliphilus]TWI63365.1 3-deoxy-D-manno-octulosonic-acid transferase [Desulfobotulus alkaliphilus]
MKSFPDNSSTGIPSYGHYRVLTLALRGLGTPFLWAGMHATGQERRYRQLRGRLPFLEKKNNTSPHIWIHGASLGEAGVTESLVQYLRSLFPEDICFTLSACTKTGIAMLEKRLSAVATPVFAPLDLPGWPEAALEARPPDIMVFVETEIWPNWIRACTDRKIPVLMVNGRISPRSFPRYLKLRPLLKEIFNKMAGFSMISDKDAERILKLGAPSEKVWVCGNAKRDPFFLTGTPLPIDRAGLGLKENTPLWICGSVRKGEEIPLTEAFIKTREKFSDLRMILAPRHLKRLEGMEKNIARKGLSHQRRSHGLPLSHPVLFLDTMGELRSLYALADVVFCGGSLVPAGGQNLLEAAAWAKPILFGPSMEDFSEEKKLLTEAGAAFEIRDADTLSQKLCFFLRFPEKAREAGEAGLNALRKNQGALSCHTHAIIRLLQK